MRKICVIASMAALIVATLAQVPYAHASDWAFSPFPMPDLLDAPPPPGGPVRRYLTSYVKEYPFGRLREDYTPLGQIGEPKAVYYGRHRHYATLHKNQLNRVRADRAVLTTRY